MRIRLLTATLAFLTAGYAYGAGNVHALDAADGDDDDVVVKVETHDDAPKAGKDGRERRHFTRKVMRYGGKSGFLHRYKTVWKSLDLTAEQRDKLFAMQQKYKRAAFDVDQTHEKALFDLQNQLAAEALDDGKLQDSVDALTDASRKSLQARIEFVKEMRAALTPAQLKALHENMAKLSRDLDERLR